MLRPKKNSCKEFDNEKKFLQLENSPPPHNFSNGPSLKEMITGSLSLPFPLFCPANFSRAFYFHVFSTIWEPGTGYLLQRSQELYWLS